MFQLAVPPSTCSPCVELWGANSSNDCTVVRVFCFIFCGLAWFPRQFVTYVPPIGKDAQHIDVCVHNKKHRLAHSNAAISYGYRGCSIFNKEKQSRLTLPTVIYIYYTDSFLVCVLVCFHVVCVAAAPFYWQRHDVAFLLEAWYVKQAYDRVDIRLMKYQTGRSSSSWGVQLIP